MKIPYALIIEDDAQLAIAFAKALDLAQFKTEVVTDGYSALTHLSQSVPDIILLDLHLPNIPGKVILHKIRTDQRFAQTRIILATADPLLGKSLRSRADLLLIKPISPLQLRDLAARFRSIYKE